MNQFFQVEQILEERDGFSYTDNRWHEAELKLRKLLKDIYGDRQALCLSKKSLPSYIKEGFVRAKDVVGSKSTVDLISDLSRISESVPRSHCEFNPLYRQFISQIVPIDSEKKVFTFNRRDSLEIGSGGHISLETEIENRILLGSEVWTKTTYTGIEKEVYFTFEGFLYDSSTPQSSEHLGLLFFLHIKKGILPAEGKTGKMMTIKELSEKYEQLNNWSQMMMDTLFK